MHSKWRVCIITASVLISECCVCVLNSVQFSQFYGLLEAVFTNISNSWLRYFGDSSPPEPCSTPLHPTPPSWLPDLKNLLGKHRYLAAAASHQLSDQIGVASSEERCYLNGERRGRPQRRSHLSPSYELRQHQTRIKSTNWADPG